MARGTAVAAALSVAAAAGYVARRTSLVGVEGGALGRMPGVVLLALLVFGYLALGVPRLRAALAATVARRPRRILRALAWPTGLWTATLAYAGWVHVPVAPRAFAYAAYAGLPVITLAWIASRPPAGRARRMNRELAVGAVVLALLAPAALRWLPPLPVPGPGGADVAKYLAYAIAAWAFFVVMPIPHLGYEPRLDARALRAACLGFLLFVAVAVPLGFATGFIAWHPRFDADRLLLLPVLLTLTTAVPEELVFRGVVQRLVEGPGVRRRGLGLAVASGLFGLAHLPDPRYVLLATIAGAVYGLVYQRTGVLLASVATHVLVDWSWAVFFRG